MLFRRCSIVFFVAFSFFSIEFSIAQAQLNPFVMDGPLGKPANICIQSLFKPCLIAGKHSVCMGVSLNGWTECEAKTHSIRTRECSQRGVFGYCLAYNTTRFHGSMVCSRPTPKFAKKCKWHCQQCQKHAHIRKNVCIEYEIKCAKTSQSCAYLANKNCELWGQPICHNPKVKCVRYNSNRICVRVGLECTEQRKICLRFARNTLSICGSKDLACLEHKVTCKKRGDIYVE